MPVDKQSNSSIKSYTRYYWPIVYLIVVITFGLRFSQIGHGLPDVQISDENSDLSTTARLLSGELPDRTVRYHRTIISNVEMIAFGGVYVWHFFRTGDPSLESFKTLFFSDRAVFTFASRLLIVIISTLAVLALADIARKAVSPLAGIIAALLMCFNYFWNMHTLYATPDSLIPSAIIFFLWTVFYVLRSGTRLSYILTGLALAFVMLCKLSALPIAVTLIGAHVFRTWNVGGRRQFFRRLIWTDRVVLMLLAVIVGNLALNPFAFIHLNDLAFEITDRFQYGYGADYAVANTSIIAARLDSIMQKTASLATYYMGIPMSIAVLTGITVCLFQRQDRQKLLLLLFGTIVLWLGIATQLQPWFHAKPYYWMVLMPMLIIMGGIGAAKLLQLSQSVKAVQWQGWVFLFAALTLVAGFILNEVAQTLRVATTMRRDYTFIQAQAYINEHWPKSTAVLMGQNITWSVPIQRDDTSISRARKLGASELQGWSWWQSQPPAVRRYEYNIFGPELQAVLETREDVYRLLVNEKIEYVIEADYCGNSESSAAAISPVEFPPIDSGMRSGLQLIQTFSPFDEGQNCRSGAGLGIYERTWLYGLPDVARFYRPGPIIRLYKVDFSAPVFNDSVILGNTN